MQIRYHMDPKTGLPHIYEHNVSEQEVEDVLRGPLQDVRGRENSRIAIGQTEEGRYLRVIYVPDPVLDSVFVITAYELRSKRNVQFAAEKRKNHDYTKISTRMESGASPACTGVLRVAD